MYIASAVKLIYVGQSQANNGSPIALEQSKTVKCSEMETFSNNYYNDQQRNMRQSKNLVVPTYLTEDITVEGISYELMFCEYQGKRYRVRNILKLRGTRRQMILDIQEVR